MMPMVCEPFPYFCCFLLFFLPLGRRFCLKDLSVCSDFGLYMLLHLFELLLKVGDGQR